MSVHNLSSLPLRVNGRTAHSFFRNGFKVSLEAQGSVFKAHVHQPSRYQKSRPVASEHNESECLLFPSFDGKEDIQRGGKRGKVDGLSWASRRRFLEKVKRVDTKILPLFVTLTLPNILDCFEVRFPVAAEMKAHLEKFRKRMIRRFRKFAAFWRMEIQDKRHAKILAGVPTSQGNVESGVPYHFHLLVWGLGEKSLKYVRARVAREWQKSLGANAVARTEVAQVKSFKGVAYYASKYLCKAAPKASDSPMVSLSLLHIPPLESMGRVWGILNKTSLPWAQLFELYESFGQWFFKLRRSARKAWNFRASKVQGFTLFCEGVEQWMDYGLKLIG